MKGRERRQRRQRKTRTNVQTEHTTRRSVGGGGEGASFVIPAFPLTCFILHEFPLSMCARAVLSALYLETFPATDSMSTATRRRTRA